MLHSLRGRDGITFEVSFATLYSNKSTSFQYKVVLMCLGPSFFAVSHDPIRIDFAPS